MSINLSNDLKKVKILLNYTDNELATDIGVSRITLSRWLNNKSFPNISTLNKIYSYIYNKGIKLNLIDEELYKSNTSKNNILLFIKCYEILAIYWTSKWSWIWRYYYLHAILHW